MTQKQRLDAITRAKPLFDFLDSYGAKLINSVDWKQSVANGAVLYSYLVNWFIVASIGPHGWDLFLPASKENSTDDTLKRAEEFLGPRSGDGHLEVA